MNVWYEVGDILDITNKQTGVKREKPILSILQSVCFIGILALLCRQGNIAVNVYMLAR